MKLKEIEVGKDSAGNPVYNLYAFCYHCKTKVNIDKLKKAAKERKEAEQLADAKREAAQRRGSFQICCHKRYYGSSTCLSKNSGDPFPECYFPVRPHQLLPTVRRKSPHQNLRKHLLRRKNLMLPAPARLKSLQKSVTVRMTLILMMTITTTFNRIK